MITQRSTGRWYQVVLRALLSLLLVFAPLLAQMAMTGHASAAHHSIAPSSNEHAYEHGQSDATQHNHAHSFTTVEAEDAANHDTNPTAALTGSTHCPSGSGDQHNAGDAGCCGTFCHSSMALLAVPVSNHRHGGSAFISFAGMPTESVAPEQPHRPPSILLSL
jgi:hypothetical protein